VQRTLCILIDPDKPEAYREAKLCIEKKDLINKYDVEVWVGTSKENFQTIRHYTKMLSEAGISNLVIFPGRPDHALCYGKGIKKIFRPVLLNYTKGYMNIFVSIGKFLTSFFSLLYPGPKLEDYGYLITNPNSTVGRKLGSRPLDEKGILSFVKYYGENFPEGNGVYLEAGSGAKQPLSLEVIKKSRSILPKNMKIIVGGGVKSPEEAREYFEAGADRVVVGTHFEKKPEEIESFIRYLYQA
jgi:phosphoglycerol geranylgeranyltransferase